MNNRIPTARGEMMKPIDSTSDSSQHDSTRRELPRWLAVAVLATLLFFTRLGAPKLWDRDEPRNARCAWEMFERDDWVVPTFNGELRTHKPILLYWLMISAYHVGGVSEWTARAGSALLSVGTVLLTYGIGRRLLTGNGGLWAAVVLSTTLMFNVAAHAATPDACLIFCCTLAFFALVHGTASDVWQDAHEHESDAAVVPTATVQHASPWTGRVAAPWAWLAFLALGLGVLAKGPVGFVLPLAVWGIFIWWCGPRAQSGASLPAAAVATGIWRRLDPRYILRSVWTIRPLSALAIATFVAAPWYVLVGQQTQGVWLREFFLEHNVGRAMRAMEGHQGNPLWFYPLAILVGFFPWSVFALPVGLWTWRRRNNQAMPNTHVFLLAWIGVIVAAFSFASTKLPSYVTPTYPAIALLCGDFLASWQRRRWSVADAWPRRAALTLAGIGLALCIGLPIAAYFLLPGEAWLGLLGLIPIVGGVGMWRCFSEERITAGFRTAGATAILLSLAIWGILVPQVSRHQQISSLLEHLNPPPAEGVESTEPTVASIGVHEPSWVYYFGHTLPLLDPAATRAAAAVLREPGGQLIISESLYQQLQHQLPRDAQVRLAVPYFLKNEQLLLLERPTRHVARKSAH